MKKSGFTLVELVITITILVILSTIAFVSFQSYTQDSRDANRLSSLNEIQKGLTLSYSKNGSFPTPKNATTYTGGTISLLQGTLTQEILPELQSDPKDPLSKSSYTYSTTSDGEYFQIASDIENTDVLSQTTPQKTYAKVSSALVKGNYKFDPSLPSLIVIPTTSLTNSGIFSPDNCFVTNGGSNTIANTTCTTKKQSLLKTTDSSLVGYWDMETLTGTQLLDLSGNGNNAYNTGSSFMPSIVQGYVGKAGVMSGAIVLTNDLDMSFNDSLSLLAVASISTFENPYPRIIANRHFSTLFMNCAPFLSDSTFSGSCKGVDLNVQGVNTFGGVISSATGGSLNNNYGAQLLGVTGTGIAKSFSDGRKNNIISMNTYYFTIITFEKNRLKVYINGKKIDERSAFGFQFLKNTINSSGKFVFLGGISETDKSRDFKGIIDEVKIYNRALSDKEIEQQAKILGF